MPRQMTWIEGELYFREEGTAWKHFSCHKHTSRIYHNAEEGVPDPLNLLGWEDSLGSPGWPVYQFLHSHNWQLVRYDGAEISSQRGVADAETVGLAVVRPGMVVRHLEHGTIYRVLSVAKHGKKVTDKPPAVLYQDVDTMEEYWREYEDFKTGKFEEVLL